MSPLRDLAPVEQPSGESAFGPGIVPSDPVVKLVARSPLYVSPDATVLSIAEVMVEECVGAVLVRGPSEPGGIVSERDVVAAVAGRADVHRLTARDVMTTDLACVKATDTIRAVARRMVDKEVRHLAVTRGGVTIGVVSMRDVLTVFSDEPDHDIARR
jgi:signal-transduction protein with cAMP-binding, CBS, and nucleotidyltransferase domain